MQFCKHTPTLFLPFFLLYMMFMYVYAKTAYLFLKAHNAVLAQFTVPTYSLHFLALRQEMPAAAL